MKRTHAQWLITIAAVISVWMAVYGIQRWMEPKKITAARLKHVVESAQFVDLSDADTQSDAALLKKRDEQLRNIAKMVNGLDFRERELNRQNQTLNVLFERLNAQERNLLIDLTLRESMNQFMTALDQMPAQQRQKFIQQGLAEISNGRTAQELEKTRALGSDVMEKISQEGMRAYFEKASTETKMDLAPLMESINDIMQGMSDNPMIHNRR